MRDALRAGIAVYNAGEYHGAHDAWEDHWLDLQSGSDDERFLHGLIQFTAALHHARASNWDGLAGLVASARDYLEGLPADYRGVNVGTVRASLDAMDDDPEVVERVAPPPMTHEGEAVALDDLDVDAAAIAAAILAGEHDRYEEAVVERAVEYARAELAEAGDGQFVALVMDFAADAEHRDLVYQRLEQHVQRRDAEREDVEGLFDTGREREGPFE
jgi:predicted metal-dependent hydrolase